MCCLPSTKLREAKVIQTRKQFTAQRSFLKDDCLNRTVPNLFTKTKELKRLHLNFLSNSMYVIMK